MATYTSSGDGYFTDVVTASHTSSDTIIIRQGDLVTGNIAIDCYDMYVSGSLNTMSGSTSYNITTADKLQVGIGTAPGAVDSTLTCNDSTLSIASGSLTTLGLFLKENATVEGGTGEWFVGTLNADGGNDNILTMTTGACWINGSYSDKICLAMRGNTTFNANGGLIGICGTGAQYYYERNNTARVFNNFMIDKVVGAGGGGVNAANGTPIATSIFAPYSAGVPSDMTVLRYLHNNGGIFDLLGQDASAELTDVPANCMNLHVSGNMQMGGNFGGSLGDPQNWRGTCKLLPRSADVELVHYNVWNTQSSVPLVSGSDLNGGWQNTSPETGTDGQTDQYMYMYRATYPYSLAMRGDTYISGGTARIKTASMEPWMGDGKVNFSYDNFVSGNSIYSRIVPPTGNNSAFFGGTNSYVRVADDATLRPETAMTLACWINQDTTDGTHRLMHKYAANEGYLLSTDAGKIYWEIWIDEDGTPTRYESYSHGTIVAGAWTHIGITYDSVTGYLREYQNGVVVDTTDLGTAGYSIATGSEPFSLGYSANSIQGQMCDARIYSTVKDGDDFAAFAAVNPATDLSTGNYGKYASTGSGLKGWWRLQRSVTGSLDSTDSSEEGNDGTQNGTMRCHSGFWQLGNRNANSAVLMNSYQSDLMGGTLGNADYPETAYGAADGYTWSLDCASGSLFIIAPTMCSGNARAGSEARIYQTQPNYGNPTAIGLDQDQWWHFWNISVTNGDWGATTYKAYSTNFRQCFFTRIHGDLVIGEDSQGPAVYGYQMEASVGGDFHVSTDKWAYYTCAGPYGDIIIDGALVVGASGGFDYAGTRDSTNYKTPGWNYGSATIGANSNQNYIIPPKVTAGGIFCSGGQIRFAKRNPLMCDWSGIAVAEHGKTASNYPGSGTDVGSCDWTRGRFKDCNFIKKPPLPLGSLWDNEGGSRYGMGRETIDLPEVEVTQESMSISQRPWYKSYMANRSIQLQHAGNTDIFLPSATDAVNASYHGDYGTRLILTHAQVVLPAGGDLYSISGSYLQKSEQPIVYGDFICTNWSPNGTGHGMDISGNLQIVSGDGYDKNNTCTTATTNIGGNLIIESGGRLYSSGTTFNIDGSFINSQGTVYN